MPVQLMLPRKGKPRDPVVNPTSPLTRGLRGAWIFNEGGGTTVFDRVQRQDGTMVNMDPATDWVRDASGGALNFDGSNDAVNLAGQLTLHGEDNATIAALIKVGTDLGAICGSINSTSSNGFLRWTVNFDPSTGANDAGEAQLYVRTSPNKHLAGGWAFDAGFSDSQWHLLTASWDWPSTTIQLTVDGLEPGAISYISQFAKGSVVAMSHDVSLGRFNGTSPGNYYTGEIAAFYVWHRRLPLGEIAELNADPYAMFRRPVDWTYAEQAAAPPATGDFPFRRYYSGNFGGV